MREKIKSLFRSRVFYIIFSVLASIALWVFVDYSENREISWPVNNIPVEFINDEIVTDRQLIITERGAPVISVTFDGIRSAVSRLNSDSVRAVVDLLQINSAGELRLEYTLMFGDGIDDRAITPSKHPAYIAVEVEELSGKEVIFEPRLSGNIAADGYIMGDVELSAQAVNVSGPRSLVESIEAAAIDIRRENLRQTLRADMGYTLIDAEGNEVRRDMLTVSAETVHVTLAINLMLEVPLQVDFVYGAGAAVNNVIYEITPETVTFAGPAELMTFNAAQLRSIDLTSFESESTITRQIPVPEGTFNVTGIREAEITVSIRGLATKRVQAYNIQLTNTPDRYTARIITTSLDVTLRGTSEMLADVTADNVRIVANLSEYADATGTFTVPAIVSVDGVSPNDVGAIGVYEITVELSTPYGSRYG